MQIRFSHRIAVRIAAFSILLAGLLCACSEKDETRGNPEEWPVSITRLYRSCVGGKFFVNAKESGGVLKVEFDGSSTINIPDGTLRVVNSRHFGVPDLSRDDGKGMWLINGEASGVYIDEGKTDEDSYPVCLWFDRETITLFLSNGNSITGSVDITGRLTSFSILKADNPKLKEDIVFSIGDGQAEGTMPEFDNTEELKLIPRFEFKGKYITVEGLEQQSGISRQDFSRALTYAIEQKDGKVVKYTVLLVPKGDFPVIYIDCPMISSVTKRSYIEGKIIVEDPGRVYSDVPFVSLDMSIKGRGNSTWEYFPKKPYHIKLDTKASLYGMPANRDWILMANYNDKSLMRNRVAFEMSRICGFDWTPLLKPAEVYINGSYMGLYELGEHKEVAKHRVDIDVEGGDVYLELECYPDENINWWTRIYSIPLTFKDPAYPGTEVKNRVTGHIDMFEKALQSADFGKSTGSYMNYIDVRSFIDNYIIEEICKDYDGNLHKSTFFSKTKDGPLKFCHLWDFDLSLGNCNFFGNYGIDGGPTGFFVRDYGFQGYGWGWYYRMFQDPEWRKLVKDRWIELYPVFRTEIPRFVREHEAFIRDAAGRNFRKWAILGINTWSNMTIPGNYAGEVQYMLDFFNRRLEWLDAEIRKW